jgi:antitoxin MazE
VTLGARKPENKYDPQAAVFSINGVTIGSVKRLRTEAFHHWLATRHIDAKVERTNGRVGRPRLVLFIPVRNATSQPETQRMARRWELPLLIWLAQHGFREIKRGLGISVRMPARNDPATCAGRQGRLPSMRRRFVSKPTRSDHDMQARRSIMEGTMLVSKWDDSLAVRLPQTLVDELGLKEGDELKVVEATKGQIAVEKIDQRAEFQKQTEQLRWSLPEDYKLHHDEAKER